MVTFIDGGLLWIVFRVIALGILWFDFVLVVAFLVV